MPTAARSPACTNAARRISRMAGLARLGRGAGAGHRPVHHRRGQRPDRLSGLDLRLALVGGAQVAPPRAMRVAVRRRLIAGWRSAIARPHTSIRSRTDRLMRTPDPARRRHRSRLASRLAWPPPAAAAAQAASRPAPSRRRSYGTFGFDVAGMDRSVAPGRRFLQLRQRHLGEEHRRSRPTAPITACSPCSTTCRSERTRDDPRGGGEATRLARSAMPTPASSTRPRSRRRASRPIQPWLARIEALDSTRRLSPPLLAEADRDGVTAPFGGYVGQDDKNPDSYDRTI